MRPSAAGRHALLHRLLRPAVAPAVAVEFGRTPAEEVWEMPDFALALPIPHWTAMPATV
jgi:hypothetical protein